MDKFFLPNPIKPGPLSRVDADAINRLFRDAYAMLGGLAVSPPLTMGENMAGTIIGLDTASIGLGPGLSDVAPDGSILQTGSVEICGFAFECCTTYTLPSASNNDVNLPSVAAKMVYDLTGSSNPTIITGIVPAQFRGVTGPQVITLTNVGSNPIQINNNSASSAAANRILLPPTYGSSVALAQNDTIVLWYDTCTNNKWLVLACTVDTDGAVTPAGIYAQTNSVTVANSVAETTLAGTGAGSLTLAANFFAVGTSLRVIAGGNITTGGGSPVITFRIKDTTGAIATTAATLQSATFSGGNWWLVCDLTCRTTGAGGTGQQTAHLTIEDGGAGSTIQDDVSSTGWLTDTTVAQTLNLTAQWGTASASNTVTCTVLVVTRTYP